MNKPCKIGIAALSLVLCATSAHAATAVASMDNVVTVIGTCTISATGFTTTYDPIGANASAHKDVTGSVSTICTTGASVVVTLGQGIHAAVASTDAVPLRQLSSGGATPIFLRYELNQDATHIMPWGNTTATGMTVTGTGTAVINSIYARIFSGQTAAKPGTYTDTVVATVTF